MFIRYYQIILLFICFSAIYISCSGGSGKSENSEQIAGLWKQNCSICHGNDGRLGVNGAKDLRLSELDLDSRMLVISNGRGKMIGFKNSLSVDQIKSLAQYTFTFK